MDHSTTQPRGKLVEINQEIIKDDLGEMVRSTVADTLNGLLHAEATRLCNAEKYERAEP